MTNSDVCPLNWEQKQTFEQKLNEMEREEALTPSYSIPCCYECTSRQGYDWAKGER